MRSEVTRQWMTDPPKLWLDRLFEPISTGGLGLLCPVVMVHGNHEGFPLLAGLLKSIPVAGDVPIGELPRVDPAGRLSYLPGGWRTQTDSGLLIGGIGGIDREQRKIQYHDLAYITDKAVQAVLEGSPLDVLLTHAGPARLQGFPAGAPSLDAILDAGITRSWFHGHSLPAPDIQTIGTTTVVPLHGVPFRTRGPDVGQPGEDAWCLVSISGGGRGRQARAPRLLARVPPARLAAPTRRAARRAAAQSRFAASVDRHAEVLRGTSTRGRMIGVPMTAAFPSPSQPATAPAPVIVPAPPAPAPAPAEVPAIDGG